MSKFPVYHSFEFSYKINDEYAYSKYKVKDSLMIDVIDTPVPGQVTFKLSPEIQHGKKWGDIATFYITVNNKTNNPIEDFNLKVTMSDNLTYIKRSLMNLDNGKVYLSNDWTENYCNIGTLGANETFNLCFSVQIKDINTDYIKSPLTAINTTTKLPIKSNIANIYLSQEKIEVTNSGDGKKIYIENKGTIGSKTFSYKYEAPQNSTFESAYLNGDIFNDISHVKLGKYLIFKIGSLPVSTLDNTKILVITLI